MFTYNKALYLGIVLTCTPCLHTPFRRHHLGICLNVNMLNVQCDDCSLMFCCWELLVKCSGTVAVTSVMLNSIVHDFGALRSCAALFSFIHDWTSSSHFRGLDRSVCKNLCSAPRTAVSAWTVIASPRANAASSAAAAYATSLLAISEAEQLKSEPVR